MPAHHTRTADAQYLEAAATRNFSGLFAEAKYAPLHADLARDIDKAMQELAAFCDDVFCPHDTHALHAEMRDLTASMACLGFASPERLTQFAHLRATVEGLWLAKRNTFALAPLAQHEYTRMLLRLDLALVRLKVQVLLKQIEG